MIFSIWDNEIEKKEKQKKWTDNFRKIGEEVYTFFVDTVIEKGYENREGQWDMSCEITDAMKRKQHILVEAGVGIGKTFAYIVPLLFYHKKYGRPIVIATSTIALQEQLESDINVVENIIGYHPEIILVKGQNHFLCRNRADQFFFHNKNKENNKEIYEEIENGGCERNDWDINISDKIWNQINVREFNPVWHPDEKDVYFNDKTYNGLIESFKELEYRRAELVKLLNNIASKMSLRRILESDIDEKIKIPRKYDYFEDYFEAQDRDGKNEIINEYSRSVFKKLRRNLNLISLDIHFEDNEFTIMSFTERTEVNDFDLNLITRWLAEKYPEVCKSYEAARKAYSSGDESGCVTHCRNILTGIFTYNKQEGREWYSGLQKACKKDKNILNVKNLKNIKQMKYDSHSADREHRYKYPRFRMISEVYAITCDLGAHINEGNVTETNDEIKVDLEEVTLEDALWILRMTEDILIWLYQTGNIND